ncbi:MAG: sodium ABC transporter ATP-binding protein [Pirellulaceae bacterium]|nr:MAG: sodium ABC transporter ATP-binding protein [Pirellulaceae bacterium]
MIIIHHLVKEFRVGRRAVRALDGVSFTVHPGEVFGLLGPNGAGKTTTLRIIMGLIEPDAGFAEIGGYRSSPDDPHLRSHLGLVSTNDGVYPWLTPREMLLYFADLYGMTWQQAQQRLDVLAERLALQAFMDQRCGTLSTGQRQRVILARGLMHDPPVMLLDEPTRGLDIVGSQTVFDFIDHLKGRGKAVLLSTHRLDEAERICDRFGLLHQGNLMYTGTLDQLRKKTGKEHLADMFLGMMERAQQENEGQPCHQ